MKQDASSASLPLPQDRGPQEETLSTFVPLHRREAVQIALEEMRLIVRLLDHREGVEPLRRDLAAFLTRRLEQLEQWFIVILSLLPWMVWGIDRAT